MRWFDRRLGSQRVLKILASLGMSSLHQHGLFDVQIRHEKIKQYATMLDQLNTLINWEEFRPTLEATRQKERKTMRDVSRWMLS